MLGWLFGIKDLSGGSISDLRISFTRITASWHWFAVLGLMAGLAALVAWLYYREPSFVRNRKKVLLGVLRLVYDRRVHSFFDFRLIFYHVLHRARRAS